MNLLTSMKQPNSNFKENSILNREMINMLIIFGKTKETFNNLDIDISVVETMDIKFSESRMKDKHRSVAPPETTKLAEQANTYLNMMEDQDEVEEGESFNFSANASKQGEHYIKFSQEVIKD